MQGNKITIHVKIKREQIAKALGANPNEMFFLPEGEVSGERPLEEIVHGWANTPDLLLDLDPEQVTYDTGDPVCQLSDTNVRIERLKKALRSIQDSLAAEGDLHARCQSVAIKALSADDSYDFLKNLPAGTVTIKSGELSVCQFFPDCINKEWHVHLERAYRVEHGKESKPKRYRVKSILSNALKGEPMYFRGREIVWVGDEIELEEVDL